MVKIELTEDQLEEMIAILKAQFLNLQSRAAFMIRQKDQPELVEIVEFQIASTRELIHALESQA
jgi:hypothetical protein